METSGVPEAAAVGEADVQVQVRFVTELPPRYQVPDTVFALPGHLSRYGLSEVVNSLLQNKIPETSEESDGEETRKHIPFDFEIDGELLRCSLHAFLTRGGRSAESVLTVEYFLARAPPQLKHEDETHQWVWDPCRP